MANYEENKGSEERSVKLEGGGDDRREGAQRNHAGGAVVDAAQVPVEWRFAPPLPLGKRVSRV